ncbi:GreA/GreB family elongation factor [Bizionia paragorgiae]|jgi:regulator of nucleoside diphosphate kinase|uniref:Regulator of nucleoside diphosphate kinase n=1 Tax=Bizionia paragorgiae TaxID=283786 RepID=A0A1H3VJ31_BIZPA|nr:GreA/GreB family elongation factor [Bizionia paragorgiae]MDX1272091.1 GreA/GreB family elongation factor [Bizionia paragorgiae]SDZ74776.1 regulator of nucleoside diphosphate kinase [Bizionia paragorgiae]
MKYDNLILEKKEYAYLKRILDVSGYSESSEIQKSIIKLNEELKEARVLKEDEMPEDVVRFNSKVSIVSDQGWEKTIQVVIPSERNLQQNKISILTPMGAALFGYATGDPVVWDFPTGKQHLTITAVEQQENSKGIDVLL